MLKGKTTIQLFDAKTGEKTDEVTKTNLVTNAVRNILGGAFNQLASGNMWANGIEGVNGLFKLPEDRNFAQALYGGVLLFSKPITEDVEHCLPTIEEIKSFIGSANQSASDGSDSFRGSINEGESEIGTNYVKFVWDFKTNECNGDIASICLTSDCGGAVGYGFDGTKDLYYNRSLRLFNTDSIWSAYDNSRPNATGSLIKSDEWDDYVKCAYIDDEYLHVVVRNIHYKQNISKVLSKNNLGLSIIDGFNYGKTKSYKVNDTDMSLYYIMTCTSKDHCFLNSETSNYSNFKLLKIYGDGLEKGITIPASNINSAIAAYFNQTGENNYLSSQDRVIHNDKLYIITGQLNFSDLTTNPNKLRIWILNFDGTYTYKDVELTSKMVTLLAGTNIRGGYSGSLYGTFREYRGSLCYLSKVSDYRYNWFLVDDDGTMQTHPFMSSDDDLMNTVWNCLEDNTYLIPSPYIENNIFRNVVSYHDDELYLYAPVLVTAYLGTINNQETVLTKTPDKTMKIIYTLTQA